MVAEEALNYSETADHVIGYIYAIICVVGTIFNFMMLFVIVSKFLKKEINPTSVIMLQLCFIDLIGCSIQAPPIPYGLLKGREFNIEDKKMWTNFCDMFGYLSTLLPLLSIYLTSNLCFIRFIGVYFVFNSKRLMTVKRALMLSAVSWVIPVAVSALPFYSGLHYMYARAIGAFYMDMDTNNSPRALRLFINVIITIPFLITVICCTLVVHKLRLNHRRRERCDSESARDSRYSTTVLSRRSRDLSKKSAVSRITLTNTCALSRENSQMTSSEKLTQNDGTLQTSSSRTLNLASALRDSDVSSSAGGVTMRDSLNRTSKLSRDCLSRADTVTSRSSTNETGSSRRASITITIITVAFTISYGPYMILWIYSLLVHELRVFEPIVHATSAHWYIYLYIYLISTTLLSTFNSCIFPLIYFIRIKGRVCGQRVAVEPVENNWMKMQDDVKRADYQKVRDDEDQNLI